MAVDLKNLTPIQLLQAHLIGDQTDTLAAQDIENDPRRFEAKQRLLKALDPKTDQAEARDIVHTLATEFYDEALKPFNVTAESVANDFAKNQALPLEQPNQQEQQSSQQPQPGFVGSFLDEATKQKGTPGRAQDTATIALHDKQEENLLKAFDKALKIENVAERDNAIRNLLDNELQAPKLFGNQVDIIKEHILNIEQIGGLYKNSENAKEQVAADLRKAAEERQKKVAAKDAIRDGTEEGKKAKALRDAKDKELHDRVLSEKDPQAARDAFQILARRRIAETTRQYYVLEEIADSDGGAIAQLAGFISGKNAIARQQQARRREALEHAEQGMGGMQQAQQNQPRSNPFTSFFGNLGKKGAEKAVKGGAKDFIKSQLKKKAKQAIIKFLFMSPPYIGWWIVGILLILIIIVVVIVVIIAAISGQNSDNNAIPIPGLTLTLNTDPAGKTSYENGQNIKYVIDVKYTGPYSIIVVDQPAENAQVLPNSVTGKADQSNNAVSWNLDVNQPLPDSTTSEKHWSFNLTFSQIGKDSVFHNAVIAQYAPGSGPSNSPPPNSKPQAGGSCSPGTLEKYFGSADAAATASCICKYESGADPGLVNKSCTKGETADWSVGLFQINLDTNPQRCSGAFSQTGLTCKIASTAKLNACTGNLTDPTNNINAAVAIYHASHNTWDSGWKAEKGKCF